MGTFWVKEGHFLDYLWSRLDERVLAYRWLKNLDFIGWCLDFDGITNWFFDLFSKVTDPMWKINKLVYPLKYEKSSSVNYKIFLKFPFFFENNTKFLQLHHLLFRRNNQLQLLLQLLHLPLHIPKFIIMFFIFLLSPLLLSPLNSLTFRLQISHLPL